MSVFDVLNLLGGLALFLFGMTVLGDGLESMSGGRLERMLERVTDKVYKGVLFGALVTGVIQSSSATTVMVVGFVNAGIMKLSQTVGVIMGANIGTTVTGQILRLGDISGDALWLQMLKPSSFAPVLAFVGILLYMTSSGGKRREAGKVLLGFGILFIGMQTMEQAVMPLRELPEFEAFFQTLTNPLIGVLVGTIFTAVIQSSSASLGILQALTATGVVTFSGAVPIIFGQNIGTCITAILSSIGTSKNAKRAAAIHLFFNVIGTVAFLPLLYLFQTFVGIPFWDSVVNRGDIANFHTVFNLANTLLLLPFHKGLEKLALWAIKDKSSEPQAEVTVLDERFLSIPSLALEQSRESLIAMFNYAKENFDEAGGLLQQYDEKKMALLYERENAIDRMESSMGNYLVRLTHRALAPEESLAVSELLHAIGDVERIGDYSVNVAEMAEQNAKKNIIFSESARNELDAICDAVNEILVTTYRSFVDKNAVLARRVEPLEEVIDLLNETLKNRHVERLKEGQCSVEAGTQYLEILINLERIADHCSNVAVYVIQGYGIGRASAGFDSHEYIRHLHEGNTEEFNEYFRHFKDLYVSRIDGKQ